MELAVVEQPVKPVKWSVAKFLLRYLDEWAQKHDVGWGFTTEHLLPADMRPVIVHMQIGNIRVELMSALMMSSHCAVTFNGMKPEMCSLGEPTEWAITGFLESERVRWLINLLKHGCFSTR